MSGGVWIGGGICLIIVFIVSIILYGVSFAIIDLNFVALKKDKFSNILDSTKIFKPGRYFVSVNGQFLTYPSSWQYIRFSRESGSILSSILVFSCY